MASESGQQQNIKDTRPQGREGEVVRSGLIVSAMTFLSRILGQIREIVFATFFGDSAAADAFFVAFKIPNFMRRLFAEGAFSQAFVPVLSEYRKTRTVAEVRLFLNHVAGKLSLALMAVTVIGVLGAPVFAGLFGFGFYLNNPVKFQLTADLLRITFPYLLLISLTGFAGSILNSYGRFAVPAVTPVLLNICLISFAVLVSPLLEQPVMALAWAVLLAGIIQLVFQLPFLARINMLPSPVFSGKHEGVGKVLKLMAPIMFSVSVSQINLMLDTMLATFQVDGSVSWLYYSDRLMELPLGIFGVAIATVILPGLSRIHAVQNDQAFNDTLNWGLRIITLVGVPASTALILLAEPMIYTLYRYGEFGEEAVMPTVRSLQVYSLGLMGFMSIKIMASAYFSRQDTVTPVRIAIIAMVVNMVFNLMLIMPLAHVGLALATSISATVNAALLIRGLLAREVLKLDRQWIRYMVQIGLGVLAMAIVLVVLRSPGSDWQDWSAPERALQLFILCAAGGLSYFLVLFVAGLRPRHFVHRIDH